MQKEGEHRVQHFDLPRKLVDRVGYIVEHCEGKKVLHVGCVDFTTSGDWQESVESESWLHGQLERVASEILGVDNAEEGIRFLQDRCGRTNVKLGDASELETLGEGRFDVVVAGEIIEHMPCPGALFESALEVIRPRGEMIVSTINAYCLRRFLRIPFGQESVHLDHVSYFSHRTLYRLAETMGYKVLEQASYRTTQRRPFLPYFVERVVSFISPNLCEGILCRVAPNTE